jgi:hypothetical protein
MEGSCRISKGRHRRYLRPAAAVSMAGGALALGWLRELAEVMWLGVADSMAASASSGRLPGRRIEDGRRRRFSAPANCVARRRRKAWRARARRSFGLRSYIGHRARGWAGVHGTDAMGKAAAGASRVRHGHWGVGDLGPDGLSRAGS